MFFLIIPFSLLAGCLGDGGASGEIEAAEEELVDLMAEVKVLEEKRKALRKERTEKESKAPKKSSGSSKKGEKSESMVEAEEYLVLLERGVEELDSQIAEWKTPLRRSFSGLPFKGLELANGEVIPQVKIGEITDDMVQVFVDKQSRELKWDELSTKSRLALVHGETVISESKK